MNKLIALCAVLLPSVALADVAPSCSMAPTDAPSLLALLAVGGVALSALRR